MKKLTLSVIFSIAFLLVASGLSYADTTCQPIYGGGQTCITQGNLLIDKKVQHPQSGSYVDNLGVNDPKYGPDQTVNFQINITNTGASTLSKVTVKDILPQYVTFVSGPGSYDSASNTVNFELADLKANETRTVTITGKVASVVPQNQTACVVNQAQATADSKMSQDNAQFCIEQNVPSTSKGGTPTVPAMTKGGIKVFPPPTVTSTPPTGPEALALVGLLPTGALGYFLRRKSLVK